MNLDKTDKRSGKLMRNISTNTMAGLLTLLLENPRVKSPWLLCLFHGYGASAENLLGLVERLDLPDHIHVALPNAPLERFPGEHTNTFAWWEIHLDGLIERRFSALNKEGPKGLEPFYNDSPLGLPPLRIQMSEWLEKLRKHYHLPWERIILGGFSQGAMLATDMILHLPNPIAGVCLFSGALLNRPYWETRINQTHPIPRFQSHGIYDPILPFEMGEALHRFLNHMNIQGEFLPFPGVHEISEEIALKARAHLVKWTNVHEHEGDKHSV